LSLSDTTFGFMCKVSCLLQVWLRLFL